MFQRLGQFVVQRRLLVIAGWLTLVVVLRLVAPSWDSVTRDGDLAYLPATAASVRGEKLLSQAFPGERQKSQLVVIVEATRGRLDLSERPAKPADSAEPSSEETAPQPHAEETPAAAQTRQVSAAANQQGEQRAPRALSDAEVFVELEERLHARFKDYPQYLGLWSALKPAGAKVERTAKGVLAERLRSSDGQAGLVVVQLSTEFMATSNMPLFEAVLEVMDEVRALPGFPADRLQLGICGSAAVGADMLVAAKESIRRTEVTTVVLVVLILLIVYRAPLLAVVSLLTITASVMVACDLVSLLTRFAEQSSAFEFKVFKTTKIFIVVILFGAGTDFCLFLIARFREELLGGASPQRSAASALGHVGEALVASALTTVGGLAMMAFADFGKFRFSGPALGLSMAVALAASCTLAPALISIMGRQVFWPWKLEAARTSQRSANLWRWISRRVTVRPGLILAGCFLVLGPLAYRGLFIEPSYALLDELHAGRPSVQGTQMLYRHFDRGDTGPVVVIALQPRSDFHSVHGEDAIYELTEYLANLPGVARVRSLTRPLGDEPPETFGLFGAGEQEGQVMAAEDHYVSTAPPLEGKVARFDVVLQYDPFSPQSAAVLDQVREALQRLSGPKPAKQPVAAAGLLSATAMAADIPATPAEPSGPGLGVWQGAQFEFVGPTVATSDLRDVTTRDQRRIQVLCVAAVLMVLMVILRRPLICCYLIVSVVFSFLVAIGATQLLFETIYGPDFGGLDWKVPLFLFVILVAIGEDYNIYLASRVFEEQRRLGPLGGLRVGMQRTGGIITSCGLIMAGTFVSMMTGSLRGMLELGFALSLGVLLDTFLVRTVLVPAFLALLLKWEHRREARATA